MDESGAPQTKATPRRRRSDAWLLLGLAIVLVVGLLAIGRHLQQLAYDLVRTNSTLSSSQYAAMLRTFRALYTSEVVTRARAAGMPVTHDYAQRDGAIPLPATLTILLGERMGLNPDDVRVRLYSPYPFPWRQHTGGLRDAFERDAWEQLRRAPDTPFVRVEAIDGVPHVRYAIADRLQAACVGCHNSHPDSPRTGWKEGDVRGVLEVAQPLAVGFGKAEQLFSQVFWLMAALLTLGIASIAWFITRLRREFVREQRLSAELRQVNLKLGHEIKVRQRTEASLLTAKQAADSASEAKSIFLANMSHEIRTPMNVILGHAQLLARQADRTGEEAESLALIQKSGRHLIGLISDIIDISKIEAGVMTLKPGDFDLDEAIENVAGMLRFRAQQKNLQFVVDKDFAEPPGTVHGDAGKLSQVLINLLGNAVKFTEQGTVRLRVSKSGPQHYRFEVADTGPGIPEDQQAQVLQAFAQTDLGASRGGAGLGLTISSRQLELMGSRLELASTPGVGTRTGFELELPAADAAVRADAPAQVQRLAPGCDVHALVVDDVEENCRLLCRLLREIGVVVEGHVNAEDALAAMRERIPDILFTDIKMPGAGGRELIDRVRAAYPDQRIAFVAMSASSLGMQAEDFTAVGFDDFVSKPFLFEQIYQCLRTLLHVQFVYHAEPSAGRDDVDETAALHPIDADLRRRLHEAADLANVSALEALLQDMARQGGEPRRVAAAVRPLLQRYDMDAIIDLLEGLPDAGAT